VNTKRRDLQKASQTEGFSAQQALVQAISAWHRHETIGSTQQTVLGPDLEKLAKIEARVPAWIRSQYSSTRELHFDTRNNKYYYNVLIRKPDQGGMPDYGFARYEAVCINQAVRANTSDQFDLGAHLRKQMETMGLLRT
jgi:hypothetical protein